MPTFNYEGHLANGRAITGSIEANNEEDANQMLRQSGVFARKVSQGELSLVYEHAPKPRSDSVVFDPNETMTPPPRQAPRPEQAETKEAADSTDALDQALLKVETARRSLLKLVDVLRKQKSKDPERKKTLARLEKQIEDACTMALAMKIKDLI